MISAIVLAAGRSRRMGQQKLLLPFGGQTVIAHVVDEVLRSAVARVYVVVGRDGSPIAEALASRNVVMVTNPDTESDMLSSVRCGLQALPRRCDAVLVALADQPGITSGLINEMIRAFAAGRHGILVPLHHGQRGHPLLFSVRYRDELLVRHDDVGLRGLLAAHPEEIAELRVASPAVLSDMDYPEDYRHELASFSRQHKRRRRDLAARE